MENVNLSAEQVKAIKASAVFTAKSDGKSLTLFANTFRPIVEAADKKAFASAKTQWSADYFTASAEAGTPVAASWAERKVFRMLKRAGLVALASNAGAENGKSKEVAAKEAEVVAIVAQGVDNVKTAISAAIDAKDGAKLQRLVDALKASWKAEAEAAKTAKAAA